MKSSLLLSFAFLTAGGLFYLVASSPAWAAEPSSIKVDIHGADATKMFMALQATGVQASAPTDATAHVITLEAKTISCQAPSTLKPEATCTVLSGTVSLKSPSSAAAELLGVIKANNGGKKDPGGLGADVVAADSLVCQHEPVPHADYTCSYTINLRD